MGIANMLSFQVPTSQNGQTHSKVRWQIPDNFFECVWLFCWVDPSKAMFIAFFRSWSIYNDNENLRSSVLIYSEKGEKIEEEATQWMMFSVKIYLVDAKLT